jgi:hypothetical protein
MVRFWRSVRPSPYYSDLRRDERRRDRWNLSAVRAAVRSNVGIASFFFLENPEEPVKSIAGDRQLVVVHLAF